MGRRSWPWWKTLSAVLGSCLVIVSLALGWAAWRTNRAWARLGARIDAHFLDERQRPIRRPQVHSATTPGHAWPHYVQAVAAAGHHCSFNEKAFFEGQEEAECTVQALVYAHADTLASLSIGARCDRLTYDDLEARLRPGTGRSGPPGYVSRVAGCDAWLKATSGRPSEAVDRLLDLLQFGRDWAESGSLADGFVYVTSLYWVERPLIRLLGEPSLDPHLRGVLETALKTMDEQPPDSKGLIRRNLIEFSASVQKHGLKGYFEKELMVTEGLRSRAWSHSVPSQRFVALRVFRRMERLLEMAPADPRDAWPVALHTGVSRHDYFNDGPLGNLFQECDDYPYRDGQARLRMFRMAADWLARRSVSVLEDPWGVGPLRFAERHDGFHVWSVGYNGVDDGGPDARDACKRRLDVLLTIPPR